VLGYWYVPFNAKRLRMCGAAYGRVADRNGVFSILTVFRVNPYTLSSALSEQLRNATVELLDAHADPSEKIICVLEGSPLTVAAMRVSAAATMRVIRQARSLRFVTTLEDALVEASDVHGAVPADAVRAHLQVLEAAAAASAPPGTFPRLARPAWALPLES
jgi:hypothetical protein